jgi:hypothetical protein
VNTVRCSDRIYRLNQMVTEIFQSVTQALPVAPSGASNAPAWVQAVGAVVAIFASYFIGRKQAKAALIAVNEAHRKAEQSRRKCITAIAEAAQKQVQKIEESLSKGTPADVRFALFVSYDKSIVVSMGNAIGNVPFHDVGSSDGVIALLMMRDQFVFLGKAMQALVDGTQPGSDASVGFKAIEDPVQRKEAEALWYDVKIRNARNHMGRIREHYTEFVSAMAELES